MSMVRLSRRAVGFQLSLCALKAAKYTLTLINTPFGTSTVDKKKLQFLRSENIHKKEKHAATYDVVRARPSCI